MAPVVVDVVLGGEFGVSPISTDGVHEYMQASIYSSMHT